MIVSGNKTNTNIFCVDSKKIAKPTKRGRPRLQMHTNCWVCKYLICLSDVNGQDFLDYCSQTNVRSEDWDNDKTEIKTYQNEFVLFVDETTQGRCTGLSLHFVLY